MRTISEILLFELAEAIEEDWDRYMEEGCLISEGTTLILNQYKDLVDEEDEILIYIALGLIQLELEEIDGRVRDVMLEAIEERTLKQYINEHPDNKYLVRQIKRRYK